MTPWQTRAIAKAKPSPKQLAALNSRMARAIGVNIKGGIRALQAKIPPDKLLAAFRSGKYASVLRYIPFATLEKFLDKAIGQLVNSSKTHASSAKDALPAGIDANLRYDLANPRLDKFVRTRIGSLIQNVTDETQENVANTVRTALQRGLTAPEVASRVKIGLGLNVRQSQALANYAGDDVDAYADRLLNQRADMIARTELAYANNQGQRDVWEQAQEQDLLPDGALQVWTTDYDPCPHICRPMEGATAEIGDTFTLPDGTEVDGPPAHTNCFCLTRLHIEGANEDVSREGFVD